MLQAEFNCLSRIGAKLQGDDVTFERLEVDAGVAQRMFEDNRFAQFACYIQQNFVIVWALSVNIFGVCPHSV